MDRTESKTNIFLWKHVDNMLKFEYINTSGPNIFVKNTLKIGFVTKRKFYLRLPEMNLKKVNDYSSALLRICSQLRCNGQSVTDVNVLKKNLLYFPCIEEDFPTFISSI
ncbi:hypothetical protein OSB04_001370 [Centaurea solstitialis]|uniref:Uncharacterized protein n=1 Tax=Centaurea solstitialis TaxID=347529 RepID=A0AA38TSN9_9ASTR|nr:hypothetical protein OSB04_001370 [Centaurea solstitialis]